VPTAMSIKVMPIVSQAVLLLVSLFVVKCVNRLYIAHSLSHTRNIYTYNIHDKEATRSV